LKKALVESGVPSETILIEDKSMNTKDQAVHIIQLAKKKNWHKLIIVVSHYHLLRAYLALVKQKQEQQWDGKLVMQAVRFPWHRPPAGRTKSALEMLGVEIEKIKKYGRDLATIDSISTVSYTDFRVRKAQQEDLEFVFALRNEESVRAASFSLDPITIETHQKWFEKVLADKNRQIYIIEVAGTPMAQVRFDIEGDGAEVNIAVSERFQGQG